MKPRKLFLRIQTNRANVAFADFERLVLAFGFVKDRQSGSHRIYVNRSLPEARLNLQPVDAEVKPYQIKQFLKLIEEYNLRIDGDESDQV